MVQNVLLIWLDTNIDEENGADCRNAVTQLRCVVNNVSIFTNGDECFEFINTIDNNNKACIIISGSLGPETVSRLHNMSQVDSIFIFCGDQERHEQWVKKWAKIKGVFTKIGPICNALKQVARQCEHNAMPISFMAPSGDVSKKNLDQLNCSFMYTQIMKEILLTIKFEEKHIQEFTKYCREQFADVKEELMYVEELEKEYHNKTPIWWYSCESFLYPMLNTGLRLMDVDIIIKMGFFIADLHHQIEHLHTKQFNEQQPSTAFTVYRGQGMSTEHFEQMKKTKGGLMAFNNFLSTSKMRDVSINFARQAVPNPNLVAILFVMTIDPSTSTTPFASINDVGYFKDTEDEILFSMHSVFRINDIKSMGENIYQVDLTLTSDNDKDRRVLADRIRKETEGSTGWDQLGQLLLKLGQGKKALQVYEILLKESTDEIEKARIYFQIGWAKDLQGESEALTFYEKSLQIRQQLLPPNHPDLAKSYNGIGGIYDSMGEYLKALSYYKKDLEISQKSLPTNDPDLAMSYNNIGIVYRKLREYSKALSSYEKALEIQQQSLPPNHPDLGMSYNNIGFLYENMGDYSKAHSFYERAVEIGQLSLPSNHPNLQTRKRNLEDVKKKL
jgi:hypothetical protein